MYSRLKSSDVIRYTVAFIGGILLVVLVIVAGFQAAIAPFWIWISLLALFVVLTLIVSRAFTRRWLGILIDERNKYSLSRFQMMLWTVIILSAFMAAVLANVQLNLLVSVSVGSDTPLIFYERSGNLVVDALYDAGVIIDDNTTGALTTIPGVDISQLNLEAPLQDGQQISVIRAGEAPPVQALPALSEGNNAASATTPLSVQIPSEVWLLLGISTTSLVASPLIKGQKPDAIVKNQSASEAKFSDLFKGEENGNYNLLDLGKVQLFYFTLIVIGAYMIALASLFLRTQYAIASLPALDGGVVAMLGVSHAGYLSNKAVSRNADATVLAQSAPPAPPAEGDQGGAG